MFEQTTNKQNTLNQCQSTQVLPTTELDVEDMKKPFIAENEAKIQKRKEIWSFTQIYKKLKTLVWSIIFTVWHELMKFVNSHTW